MSVLEDLRNELTEITTLKYISAAFAESSSARIGKIRDQFEKNKQYYEEISEVYHMVKVSAGVEDRELERAREQGAAVVALTSNHRFFGMLNINTMASFVDETKNMDVDRYVIGQTGADYIQMIHYDKPVESVVCANDKPTREEAREFIKRLTKYTQVFLFYPKFHTMVRQTVEMTDITQTAMPEEVQAKKMVDQIFEPELSQILTFFEDQVRALLFERALLEVDLSRTAARLLAMSAAEERADKLVIEKRAQIGKVRGAILNAQLLETFAGIKKWKKTK